MKTKKDFLERKKVLVEKYGLFMEKSDNLAPIEARIFTTLILNGNEGVTFEELVNFLEASKSTVSTNLKRLQNNNIVTYYTKPGDRKKYYYLSHRGFLAKIDEDIDRYEQEKMIINQIKDFHQELSEEMPKNKEVKDICVDDYLEFVDNNIEALQELRKRTADRSKEFETKFL